ncbi:hypothetical protein CPB97_011108 [Podila verticillata]|nr:hypothetical protein CPB97_011108 [Podila verticillata]
MSGSKVVFVGNIPYEQTEEQLIDIFSEVGPVVSFRLVFERETGKPRGYGFCEYLDERTAASAVRNLDGREIGNRSLKVDFADVDPMRNDGRDLDEGGSFMRNIGPGFGPGPNPVPQTVPMQPPMPPQLPPHVPLHQPRVDPRLANMPPTSTAAVARPPLPLQPPHGATRPSPSPSSGPSSADAISAVLGTMTPQNVYDIISSMKVLALNEPDRATAILNANPQLSYALFQALLMMNLVDPSSLQRMFPSLGAQASAPNMSAPPPPQPAHLGQPVMSMPPQGPTFPQTPPISGAPVPPQQPQQPQSMASLEQQQQLLAQVMALTPNDIASLPEDQRNNIIQLRQQLMGSV